MHSEDTTAVHRMTAVCKVFLGAQSINHSFSTDNVHCSGVCPLPFIVFLMIYEAHLTLKPLHATVGQKNKICSSYNITFGMNSIYSTNGNGEII